MQGGVSNNSSANSSTTEISSVEKIAIIGCGQLAKMMAEAASVIGVSTTFLAERGENTSCVDGLGKVVVRDESQSAAQLFHALNQPQVMTLEREQVDLDFLHALEAFCEIHPNLTAMAIAQDRLKERQELIRLGIPVAKHVVAKTKAEFLSKASTLKLPLFIKHPKLGYDGNHQWRAKTQAELEELDLPEDSFPLLVEQAVNFECEASLIAARSSSGELTFYAPAMNTHVEGILVHSHVVSDANFKQRLQPAYDYMSTLLNTWNYVGILTIELFVTDDAVIVNEIAPRVHNSGHWTMDACSCSQFESHIRAVLGLSFGDTSSSREAGMVNLLGVDSIPSGLLGEADFVHWYNKSVRPRRKMGHINMIGDDRSTFLKHQQIIVDRIYSDFKSLKKPG